MIQWIRRLIGIPEPVVQVAVRHKPAAPPRRQRYRYSVQSATYCNVLRALYWSPRPLSVLELRTIANASTVGAIIGQLYADGYVSRSRVTVGSKAYSYCLTEQGKELAAPVSEATA